MDNARTAVGETIVDFLRGVAEKHAPRDALLFKPGFRYLRWSYSRLWDESGQVATLLQRRGLTKGDQVILWGPNSPHWVLFFFGCLRAGVIVVPLDLRSAPDYVARVVSRTEPKLAFTSRFTPKGEVDLGVPELAFEELEAAIAGLPQPEDVNIAPSDLAEIMFTSGTTGEPKGVMLTHRNLTANIEGIIQCISCKPSSRLLSILPLSHMYEQMGGLFVTLYYGASTTYPTSRQPTVLARTMRERKVTSLLLVPQGLELLMNGIEREVAHQGKEVLWGKLLNLAERVPFRLRRYLFRRVHKQFGGKLDFIVSGGAALDRDLGRKWELLGVKIVQGYGATEASPVISNHTIEERRHDSTGRPLPNVEVKISEVGEILVRGENVTPGYWRAPEETAKAFDGDWYKTGDLGYFDDEGFLHIQGRVKDMIVLPSGQNVFPEDIQAVLTKHPGVKDAAVVGLAKGSSVEVHAAVILDDPGAAQEAVAWTNGQLAEHQRIRGFTVWPEEDFPRTHTLKVKKQVVLDTILGKLQQGAPDATPSSGGSPPSGARGLRHIISEISKRNLGEIVDGAALGNDLDLDSLGRVELLSAIEAELGLYMDEGQVSPETTVRELADLVEEGVEEPSDDELPELGHAVVVPHDARFPATRHPLPAHRPSLRPEGGRPRASAGHHQPGALRVEPQSRPGQSAHPQDCSAEVASSDGRSGGRGAVEKPGLVAHEPAVGQRLPAREGRLRQAEPRKHGQDHGQRVVGAHLPGRRAHHRRADQVVHERHGPRRRRRTHPGCSGPLAHPQAGISGAVPALPAREHRGPLRRAAELRAGHGLPRGNSGHRERGEVTLTRWGCAPILSRMGRTGGHGR